MADCSALEYLIGAYLNEDVFDDYPDVITGVDDFVRTDPHLVAPLSAEIDHVLATFTDSEIDELLTNSGIGFVAGDLGYRGWLTEIVDRVRSATAS